MHTARFVAVAAALVLAAAAALPAAAKDAEKPKDDAEALKAAREAVRKELKEKNLFFTYDLSYLVDGLKLDSRWAFRDPPYNDAKPEEGWQFYAAIQMGATGEESNAILVRILKEPHYTPEPGGKRRARIHKFAAIGTTVEWSMLPDIAQGYYDDWVKGAKSVVKEKCDKPQKVSVGPAKLWASVTGVPADAKTTELQRVDWYFWGTTGADVPNSWMAQVNFSPEALKKGDEFCDRAKALIAGLKPIEDKRLK